MDWHKLFHGLTITSTFLLIIFSIFLVVAVTVAGLSWKLPKTGNKIQDGLDVVGRNMMVFLGVSIVFILVIMGGMLLV